jgi:regulator of sirC expression with transglutaminase-like and TPR domain
MDFMADKQQEAKEGLMQALELDATNALAWRDVGVVYYKQKDYLK